MALRSGLRGWAGIIAAVSLAVTVSALTFAFVAATDTRTGSEQLDDRLVPAARTAAALLADYTLQQTSLRDYVTAWRHASLQQYGQASADIPLRGQKLTRLVRGYPHMPGQLLAAMAAHRTWLANVANAQLSAMASGDRARAQALQANLARTRPFTTAVRTRTTTLQAQITAAQGKATDGLVGAQRRLLAALVAACALATVIVVGGFVAVRRWLLAPFAALRRAVDAVAAGEYDTRVPAVGPAELADLGRSTEQMRIRLVTTLADRERAEEQFRGLFESSPDATLTVAADGSIVMANAQAVRLFGYARHELTGQQVEMLVPEAARGAHREHRASYFADPVPRPMAERVPLSALHRDGHEFPVEISLSALQTDDGPVVSAAVHDVSERLAAQAERERLQADAERDRAERRLQQGQRLESLGQLVGGVAHDFNNLLNVILGYTDFATEQITSLAGTDERLETVLADVKQVHDAAERAARLTHQLLIFARRDVVRPEVLDINEVVTGVDELLRRTLGEHVELTITIGAGIWPLKADRGQLEQVLVNLAVNARDAMPGGGKLTIDTENIVVDEAYASTRPDLEPGDYVRLRVSDTGQGMDTTTLDRVFEPFFTTKPTGQGTGLGLATVYGIITKAGGYAQIYSEPGLGTTVTALLPATQDAAAAERAAEPAAPAARGSGETILLVEDEASLRELARRILARNGYQVCVAATAADAVRHADDLGRRIDLLLTDIVMPEMLGNEVAAHARTRRPGLPVLYMSGYAQPVLNTHGALDADIDLLEKPFSETSLLTRVRNAIEHSGQQACRGSASRDASAPSHR